jgi:hypothetical protein
LEGKGSSTEEVDRAKKEVEDIFRERLAFKDTEIETMTTRLSRISQTNIELTQKT